MNTEFIMPVAPLFVPGDRPERFAKAAASGADAVILDLEDAVPGERKAAARQAVAAHGIDEVPVIVRINAAATTEFFVDLAALKNVPMAALMLAKAETADDVAAVHAALGYRVPVIVLVETVAAFADLGALLRAEGVVAAAFGSLDLALDLGCQADWEALAYTRGQLILHSRLAGLAAPLDGVTTVFDDPAQVEADARRAAALGFAGKLLIHPKQVAPVLDAFTPNPQAIAWARAVLDAARTGAAVQVDGAMVDKPVIERARRILSRIPASGDTSL